MRVFLLTFAALTAFFLEAKNEVPCGVQVATSVVRHTYTLTLSIELNEMYLRTHRQRGEKATQLHNIIDFLGLETNGNISDVLQGVLAQLNRSSAFAAIYYGSDAEGVKQAAALIELNSRLAILEDFLQKTSAAEEGRHMQALIDCLVADWHGDHFVNTASIAEMTSALTAAQSTYFAAKERRARELDEPSEPYAEPGAVYEDQPSTAKPTLYVFEFEDESQVQRRLRTIDPKSFDDFFMKVSFVEVADLNKLAEVHYYVAHMNNVPQASLVEAYKKGVRLLAKIIKAPHRYRSGSLDHVQSFETFFQNMYLIVEGAHSEKMGKDYAEFFRQQMRDPLIELRNALSIESFKATFSESYDSLENLNAVFVSCEINPLKYYD